MPGWWLWVPMASGSTFEIQVSDPAVTTVMLECASGSYKTAVKEGLATFDHLPEGCKVFMVRRSGTIDSTGLWSCTLDACVKEDVRHQPVTDAAGRINIILTTELPPGAALELTCSNGFRVRSSVVVNTAVFDGVPDEECTLFFKGSVPARFRPMRFGTWSCGLAGTTAVCTRQ